MQNKLHFIFAGITLVILGALSYTAYDTRKDVETQQKAITEIAGVITQGGLVVPDKDGNAMVNPLLLQAWKQANQIP